MNEAESSACLWAQRSLRITWRAAEGAATTVDLTTPFARIGSGAGADVHLPGADVPRRAFYLHGTETGIYCLNLHPSSGLAARNGWLVGNTTLRLGPYHVTCGFADEGPPPCLQEDDLAERGSLSGGPEILVAREDGTSVRQVINRVLTLAGRRPPSKLRLEHASLSSAHCAVYCCDSAVFVIDLLSAHGSRLDGEKVSAAEWRLGQTLTLGDIALTLAEPAASANTAGDGTSYFSSRHLTGANALDRLLRHLSDTDRDRPTKA